MMMVLFRISSSMAFWSLSSFSGSTFAVASSKIMMGASFKMALAMENPLFFSSGESGASFPDHGVIAFRKGFNEIMAAGLLRRGHHFLVGSLWPPEFDVVLDGVGKEIHILKDHADLVHQRFQSVLPYVLSAYSDSASVHVPEPGNQMAEGGFPAAGGAHDSRGGLIRNADGDILKDGLFVIRKDTWSREISWETGAISAPELSISGRALIWSAWSMELPTTRRMAAALPAD